MSSCWRCSWTTRQRPRDLAPGHQALRRGDDDPAGERLASGAADRRVSERRRLQLSLDLSGETVPGPHGHGHHLVGEQLGLITGADALDRLCRSRKVGLAKLADTRVELLIAGADRR